MNIKFPRGIIIDIDHVPEDFDEMIRKSFAEYTEMTAKDYTCQDKLMYIDLCRKYLHHAEDESECVMELMKGMLESNIKYGGEIPDKEDYLSVGFMEHCFNEGRTNLCDHYTGDHHVDDKIMALLVRAIKVVMEYEKDT